MKQTITALATFCLMALMLITFSEPGISDIGQKQKLKLRLKKPDIIDQVFVGYNNWNYAMQNQGVYMKDSRYGSAGGEFPRGSGKTLVFSGGIWIGTIKNGVKVVSGAEPSGAGTEFQPGRITNYGVPVRSLAAEDPLTAAQQVYLIDRTLSGSDYTNWPSDAPHNEQGYPALVADAQTWVVFNDLDTTRNLDPYVQSPSQGLGLQITLESFAYNGGPSRDLVYLKFAVANKSNEDYHKTYAAIYMDADVYNGGAHDINGCDTTRNLSFTYNCSSGTSAPFGAVGINLIQGPVVSISEASALNIQKFEYNISFLTYDPHTNGYVITALPAGQFTLGMTSVISFENGEEALSDSQRYNWVSGMTRTTGPYPFPYKGRSQPYAYPGDPLAGLFPGHPGLVDTNQVDTENGTQDQRMLLSSGPFSLNANSTQELWIAIIGAQSTDRLGALYKVDTLTQSIRAHNILNADNIPPIVVSGALASNVVDAIKLGVGADEPLSSVTVTANGQAMTMQKESQLWFGSYPLSGPGTVAFHIVASDLANNVSTVDKSYQVALLSKSVVFDNYRLMMSDQNGYLLINQCPGPDQVPSKWMKICRDLEFTTTANLSIMHIEVNYKSAQIGNVKSVYDNFDEAKIGIYQRVGSSWVFIGGQGDMGMVKADLSSFAKHNNHVVDDIYSGDLLAVFYNPDHVVTPKEFSLSPNYPNPFNPTTTIRYSLSESSHVILNVYNILGQEVKTLINEAQSVGFKSIVWDGRNMHGDAVSSGVYIYRLQAGKIAFTRKMLLIK
jgi:hypothetical protein